MSSGKLDKTDLKILSNLQESGRITNQDLAQKVHLSPSSCLQRVRRLEQDGFIISYQARLELARIARHTTCILSVTLNNHTQHEFDAFEELIQNIPEVVECFMVSGEPDFILRVICPDMERYLEINNHLLSQSSSKVHINTFVVMKENKPFRGVQLDSLLGTPTL